MDFNPIIPNISHDPKVHERKVDSAERAEKAKGVSGDDKEAEASAKDRHGDGRSAWRQSDSNSRKPADKDYRVADLSGQTGQNIDLDG